MSSLELEKFGRFFVQNTRDATLEFFQGLLDNKWNAPDLQPLQRRLSNLSPHLKATLEELVEELTTAAMHDLLFAFQEAHDTDDGIEITVDDKAVAELSDGLHGEIFGEDGWIVRFSKYPSSVEIERSRSAEKEIKRILGGDADAIDAD